MGHNEIPEMPEPESAEEWLRQSLQRIKLEAECMLEHMEKDEWGQIALHLDSLNYGIGITFSNTLQWLQEEDRVEVLKAIVETRTGQPVAELTNVVHTEDGTGYLVKLVDTTIPDTLDELMNEGEGDGGQ